MLDVGGIELFMQNDVMKMNVIRNTRLSKYGAVEKMASFRYGYDDSICRKVSFFFSLYLL